MYCVMSIHSGNASVTMTTSKWFGLHRRSSIMARAALIKYVCSGRKMRRPARSDAINVMHAHTRTCVQNRFQDILIPKKRFSFVSSWVFDAKGSSSLCSSSSASSSSCVSEYTPHGIKCFPQPSTFRFATRFKIKRNKADTGTINRGWRHDCVRYHRQEESWHASTCSETPSKTFEKKTFVKWITPDPTTSV